MMAQLLTSGGERDERGKTTRGERRKIRNYSRRKAGDIRTITQNTLYTFHSTLYSIRLVFIYEYFFDFLTYLLYKRCQGSFWRILSAKWEDKIIKFQLMETKMIDSQHLLHIAFEL